MNENTFTHNITQGNIVCCYIIKSGCNKGNFCGKKVTDYDETKSSYEQSCKPHAPKKRQTETSDEIYNRRLAEVTAAKIRIEEINERLKYAFLPDEIDTLREELSLLQWKYCDKKYLDR